MKRIGEELLRLGHFDDLSRIHQRDAVRHLGDDGQVMRDQQHRHLLRALQFLQQVQDLRLDRDVERGGGLVGDHDVRLRRERDGDHHALLLPARHLERIVVDAPLGVGDADALQPVDRLGDGRVTSNRRMALDDFGDLPADGHHRVEAGRRLLEDDADATSAHVAHLRFRQLRDVDAFDVDAAAADAAAVGQQAQDGQRRHRLAAARFADQREGLAARDRKVQRVDRAHEAVVRIEFGREVFDFEHADSYVPAAGTMTGGTAAGAGAGLARRTRKARARGSKASRTALANSVIDSTSVTMNANAASSVQ